MVQMVRGVGRRGDGVGWREYFFWGGGVRVVFVLSVERAYRILAYAMIVSL